MSEPSSDYDGAWKEALRSHLPQFVEKYFSAVHAAIDWSNPLEWLDKEVSQVLGKPHKRNREVDLLVKARLRSGGEQRILVHLEIQTSHEEAFAARIARYNSGLFWVFGERVVTLVVLADLREDWMPREDLPGRRLREPPEVPSLQADRSNRVGLARRHFDRGPARAGPDRSLADGWRCGRPVPGEVEAGTRPLR
jgi:hypothetical protein